MRSVHAWSALLVLGAWQIVAACSPSGEPAAGPSYGGASGSRGPGGSGGGGAGGSGGAGGVAGQCNQILEDPNKYQPCPFCAGGRCVPGAGLPSSVAAELADCSPTEKCVPDQIVQSLGSFTLEPCRAIPDAEGRCAPVCIPQVSQQKDFLRQGTCPANHLCAPCYDPRTGEDSGACNRGCNDHPVEPPVTFPTCCSGDGLCVPLELVPVASRSQLSALDCQAQAGVQVLCAPAEKVRNLAFKYPPCANAAGACIPACLIQSNPNAGVLLRDVCAQDEKCVPCINPLDQTRTGACD